MSKIDPIFLDPELQRQFDIDGYAKIKLIDRQKAQDLYNYYLERQKEHDVIDGLYQATTHTNNPELILQIDSHLKSALLPELGVFFQNYRPMMCTYITKQPGEGSDTKLHQDPTFVDEEKFVSANVWVALHDINHQNGNLFVVKGTHRFIRSLRVTPNCPTAYDGVRDLLDENLTEIPVSAGEAIVINHATVHGATANLSGGLRIAAVMAIRSDRSDWIYHYMEPGPGLNKIEKYQVNLDTFINLKKDGRPEATGPANYVQWNFPQISREDFIRNIGGSRAKVSQPTLLKRLSVIKEKLFS